jgi:hypothetical protein
MNACNVLIAGQSMADQHRVRTLRVERPICLIGNLEWRELHAGVELERLVGSEPGDQRVARLVRFARRISHIVHARHGIAHVKSPIALGTLPALPVSGID